MVSEISTAQTGLSLETGIGTLFPEATVRPMTNSPGCISPQGCGKEFRAKMIFGTADERHILGLSCAARMRGVRKSQASRCRACIMLMVICNQEKAGDRRWLRIHLGFLLEVVSNDIPYVAAAASSALRSQWR